MEQEQEAKPSPEVRGLRFKVKQLSKCCGRQGETIHRLRAELAEVRELNSKIDRGRLRRLERENAAARESWLAVGAENVELRAKLRAAESVLVVDAEVVEVEVEVDS